MIKKKMIQVGSAFLAGVLTFSSLGVDVYASDINVRSSSLSQMESEAENVYINNFNDASVRRHKFNANWKFNLGDVRGAESKIFDDAKWDMVSVPHDYSIIQAYDKTLEAESGYLPGGIGWYRKYFTLGKEFVGKKIRIDFDGVYNNASVYVNGHKVGMHPYGYSPFSFDITEYLKIGEENVIAVKVDHKTPSSRWYSGSGIYRDVFLTVMNPVHVDLYGQKIEMPHMEDELNKNVTMNLKTTVVNQSAKDANIKLVHKVFEKGNESQVIGTFESSAQAVKANSKEIITTEFKTESNPKLWDINKGNLYTVKTEVKNGDTVVDMIEETVGFRHFEMDNNTGASLNGKAIKLQGVCLHHDQGSLGSAAYHDAIRRQVKIMKDMGVNSIRVTHNPASQALIDICNEEGILIVEEVFDGWMHAKNGNTQDFSKWFNVQIDESNKILGKEQDMTWAEFEVKNTVSRGYHEPSIVMFSLGNEINEGSTPDYNGFKAKAAELIDWALEVNPNCLVTVGSNHIKEMDDRRQPHIDIANQLTAKKGTVGINYAKGEGYDRLHKENNDWLIYGSETASAINSRGVYSTKANGSLDGNKQLTSYDKSAVGWGATANQAWYDVINRDFVAGEYVWTGFDYIGEPTPGNNPGTGVVGTWPSPKNSYFGIVDTAGFAKDSYYFYQSQWNKNVNTLHVLPAWNKDAIMVDRNGNVEVVVYSDADKVELWLDNGKDDKKVGEQVFDTKTTTTGHTYKHKQGFDRSGEDLFSTFNVKYEEGTLHAKAYELKDGKYVEITNTQGRNSITTAKEVNKLVAKTYGNIKEVKANNEDLIYVEVDVTDKDGHIVPNAKNNVTFKVEGEGTLVGVDNGSSPDHQSYKDDNRNAHAGKVLAIVKATNKAGNIKVIASAQGLDSAVVNVTAKATTQQQTEKTIDFVKMARNLYVKVGNKPQLPQTIEITYSNGDTVKENVTWNNVEGNVSKVGEFQVSGTLKDGTIVTTNVNMISDVTALLNYSTTVVVGSDVKSFKLPEHRPAVLEDGSILNASFAVKWNKIDEDAFKKEGIVVVTGTANVFGQEKSVISTIRVQKEQFSLGDEVQSQMQDLSQNIEQHYQSDTLAAIKDGQKTRDSNTNGGANPSLWSNWKNSRPESGGGKNSKESELSWRFDTAQTIGQIEVYFAEDNNALTFPKADGVQFYADGKKVELSSDVEIPTNYESEGVKKYVYKFAPINATEMKMHIKDAPDGTSNKARPCTGIVEVSLIKATGSFNTNTTAELASLTLNGKALTADQLAKDVYQTAALVAKLDNVRAKDNAAITVLPVFNNKVKLIIESEDHKTTKVFTIELDTDVQPAPESSDYDISLNADWITVPNADSNNSKAYMLDSKHDTIWHSDWTDAGLNKVSKLENRNITVTFPTPQTIDGIRYMPREDGPNGSIVKYRVEYQLDGSEEMKIANEGTWETTQKWYKSSFEAIDNVKKIRLVGVTTAADNGKNNKYLSAAEFRVTGKASTIDLSKYTLEYDKEVTLATIPDGGYKLPVVVKDASGKVLEWGIDYKVTYKDNDKFGTAKIIVEGIGDYSGKIESTFTIKKASTAISTINYVTGSTVTEYKVGDKFNPEGLQLVIVYSDNTEKTITYSKDNASKFTFTPSLETTLSKDHTKVIVTYEGKSTDIQINVTDKAPVTPQVNKNALSHLIAKAEKYDGSLYTAESYNDLQVALANAKSVLADSMTTQKVVDDTTNLLQKAINGLKKQGSNIGLTTPEKPSQDSTHQSQGGQGPTTNDTTLLGGIILALGISAAGVMLTVRKKKSNN